MLTLTDPLIVHESPTGKNLSAPYDLDRALVEAAKEINVDWPEFLPVQRIKAGIAKTALRLLLLAGSSHPVRKRLVHRVISRRHTAVGQLADFQGGPSRTGSYDEHI